MKGLAPPRGSARSAGAAVYVLRHGSENQSAAQHLAELLFSMSVESERWLVDGVFVQALLIITDGGSHEHPTLEASKWCHAFLRWLLGLRALTVVTNASGCSELSPGRATPRCGQPHLVGPTDRHRGVGG